MAGGKGERPGFSFFTCPDSALLMGEVEKTLKKFPPSSGSWKKYIFWGDEPPDSRFWECLRQQGLFAENRAVIIRKANEWPARVWKELDGALSGGTSSIWPLFCLECDLEKGRFKIPAHIQKSRAFAFAEKNKWSWQSPPLQGNALRKYAESEAKARGLKFSGAAMDNFCALVRPDAAAIAAELDKLYLIYGGEEISAPIAGLESSSPEANAFACVRSLYAGDMNRVWREAAQNNADSFLFFIIALLAKDFHVFWQIQSGESPRLYPAEAALKRNLAIRIGRKGLSEAFVLLANAEYGVKSGKLSAAQALDQLLIELQLLFSAPRI